MIGAGLALADTGIHQARERRQYIHRRVDAAVMQVAAEYNLAFGDIAGQVGDGVGDVVIGHGQQDQLGERTGLAGDAPGTFVQAGEVGIHITRVAAPSGDVFTGRRDFTQRLAVIGDVGHNHQHVQAVRESQVFRGGQRGARRQDALDGRIIGEIDEQHRAVHGPTGAELVHKVRRLAVGDTNGGEDHRERLAADHARLGGDLRGDLVGGQTRA